jgi:tetratricopeptide (TPR) repeat protein
MVQRITAFVAKSFAEADEAKIAPIIRFLESFNKFGFILQDAEATEVESVSAKVRSLIDASDVLVGIFTRRHPVYRFGGRWTNAIGIIIGSLKPATWSAPPWILQESGYALKGNKPLILFRENDVEIPGLQGDLEYIPYDPQNPTPALQRASEMVSGLIAKVGNIRVETIVESDPIEIKGDEATAPPKLPESKPAQDETAVGEDEFMLRVFSLLKAVESREWEGAQREYEEGLQWVKEHKAASEMFWKCLYQKSRFDAGIADALDELRKLAAQNKDEPMPLNYIAHCYSNLGEYDESVRYYLAAAAISKPELRASFEIRAAEVLQKAKKPVEAKEILLRLLSAEYASEPKIQFGILQHLYSLSKESESKFTAFSIAELALHKSPEDSNFRFSLAYDYEDANQSHLSLYHYKILCEHDEKHSSGFNNFGVASAKCGLAVLATKRYKRAYELGNTLSASNLGHKYVEAGFTDDALALLKDAQSKEDCVPDVSSALAGVHSKIKEDEVEQDKVLARAEEHRKFLLSFAEGVLSPSLKTLDGLWKFPSVEINLICNDKEIVGIKEIQTQVHTDYGIVAILGGGPPKPVTRTERFEFSGKMTGRTCKFKLSATKHDDPQAAWATLSSLAGTQAIEGYMLFAEDGRTGRVAELKGDTPEKYYEVSKLA